MSVHLKVKGRIVNYADTEGWETLQLSFSQRYGLNLYLKGKKSYLSGRPFVRIDDYEDQETADTALMEIMEKVIEAERNGGGLVVVV